MEFHTSMGTWTVEKRSGVDSAHPPPILHRDSGAATYTHHKVWICPSTSPFYPWPLWPYPFSRNCEDWSNSSSKKMSWVVAIRAVACCLPPTTKGYAKTTISSSQSMKSPRKPKDSSPRKQPSIAEVQRAIGGDPTPLSSSSTTSSSSNPFMEFLSSTPIGQEESPVERKLREAAEWVVDRTETKARNGQQIILVVCLKILPVWLLLLLVASGVIKLPFDLPFMDDLLS